jgi:hypothetical protein
LAVEDGSVVITAATPLTSVVSAPGQIDVALIPYSEARLDLDLHGITSDSDTQLALPIGCMPLAGQRSDPQPPWPKICFIPFEHERKAVMRKLDSDGGEDEYLITNNFLQAKGPGLYLHQAPTI